MLNMEAAIPPDLSRCTRRELCKFYEDAFSLDDTLYSTLIDPNYFYCIPNKLRLPLIFYYGHTAVFYVNKMLLAGLIEERINFHFETLFETGVNEMSWDDTEQYRLGGNRYWPSVEEVKDYRIQVKLMVKYVIENGDLHIPITQESPWWSLIMAIEHQRIHIETTSVLLKQLPVQYLKKPTNWNYATYCTDPSTCPSNNFIQVSSGSVTLGKPVDSPGYGWDIDYGRTDIDVPPFEATQYKVTNYEYMEFIENGGYSKMELWTKEGWQWLQSQSAKHPVFWVCSIGCQSLCGGNLKSYTHCNIRNEEARFKYRAMFNIIDMPWDWPVEVNYHEAKAYCKWKGSSYRLLTEAEHCRLRGEEAVNKFQPNHAGFFDVLGNVWEWIEDDLNGLMGFKSHYLYEDYSWPFFDGQHSMMLGGSWITTGYYASQYTRNFFRRHFYQHAGFRVVRTLTSQTVPVKYVDTGEKGVRIIENSTHIQPKSHLQHQDETIDKLEEYIHYMKGCDYGQPIVHHCLDLINKFQIPTSQCLVLGCGPGYLCFQFAEVFETVIGVDTSSLFIETAKQFQYKGYINWTNSIKVNLSLSDIRKDNITFKQLTCIYNELCGNNVVIFEGFDRLVEPRGWLLKLWECVKEKGLVFVVTIKQSRKFGLQKCLQKWFHELEEVSVSDNQMLAIWRRD